MLDEEAICLLVKPISDHKEVTQKHLNSIQGAEREASNVEERAVDEVTRHMDGKTSIMG